MRPSLLVASILALAAAAMLPAFEAWGIEPAVEAAASGAPAAAIGAAWVLHEAGEPHWAVLLAALAGILLWWRGHGAEAVAVLVTVAATLGTVQALKGLVERARPPGAAVPGTDAFPSGHAAAAAVLAVVAVVVARRLACRRPVTLAVGLVAGVWTAAMGWSRLVLQFHQLGDVLAGLALGACFGLLAPTLLAWRGTLHGSAAGRVIWARRRVAPTLTGVASPRDPGRPQTEASQKPPYK